MQRLRKAVGIWSLVVACTALLQLCHCRLEHKGQRGQRGLQDPLALMGRMGWTEERGLRDLQDPQDPRDKMGRLEWTEQQDQRDLQGQRGLLALMGRMARTEQRGQRGLLCNVGQVNHAHLFGQ